MRDWIEYVELKLAVQQPTEGRSQTIYIHVQSGKANQCSLAKLMC